jgi:hypothetical protein
MVPQAVNKIILVSVLVCPTVVLGETPGHELGEALQRAHQQYAKAKIAGFAWRANRVALEQAEQALELGKVTAAQSFIELADELASASLKQAEREAKDWRTRPPFAD